MKKFVVCLIAAATALSTALLGGCINVSGVDGKDGKDGKNATAYEYYELAKQENPDLTIEEFLKQYLSFSPDEISGSISLQASINRSLLAGVSIAAVFETTATRFPFQTKQYMGLGAGAIIDLDKENGGAYVVTNCHVIYDDTANRQISDEVYIYLYGKDDDFLDKDYAIPATVVGASLTYDIALLKVENSELIKNGVVREADFTQSDDAYVGETVYAVGNPAGSGLSATQGIISKESEIISVNMSSSEDEMQADVRDYRVLRTDAAINGGNSGGGLYNLEGELVGIVNAKAAREDIDNMGYALPASIAKRLVKVMRENEETFDAAGAPQVMHATVKAAYAAENRKVTLENDRAVIAETVKVTSAGDGLEADDSILRIKITDSEGKTVEDRAVSRIYHVDDLMISARVGCTVTFTVSRGGKDVEVPVRITSAHMAVSD